MRISDWSSDVCSSDLRTLRRREDLCEQGGIDRPVGKGAHRAALAQRIDDGGRETRVSRWHIYPRGVFRTTGRVRAGPSIGGNSYGGRRSEESSVGKDFVSTCRSR